MKKFNLGDNLLLGVDTSDRKTYKVNHAVSSINKDICSTKFKHFQILFIRKNRVFNKGRYSRNRQNYRTGVY
jgi:hypothetical protein